MLPCMLQHGVVAGLCQGLTRLAWLIGATGKKQKEDR
jgi:hypothetical protein